MRTAWPQLVSSLPASPAVKTWASALELKRIEGGTLHLDTREPITVSAAHKLSRALNEHTHQPITLILRQLPSGRTVRSYSDRHEERQ